MWPAAGRCLKVCEVCPYGDDGHTFSIANSHFSFLSDEYWWSYMLLGCRNW